MALGGLNQKSKKKVLLSATWRTDGKIWFDSIEKQKRRINLKFVRDRQTDSWTYIQTDRVNDKKIIDS